MLDLGGVGTGGVEVVYPCKHLKLFHQQVPPGPSLIRFFLHKPPASPALSGQHSCPSGTQAFPRCPKLSLQEKPAKLSQVQSGRQSPWPSLLFSNVPPSQARLF